MCGRFTLRAKLNRVLAEFACDGAAGLNLAPRYNIAPTQDIAIVRAAANGRELGFARWGLVPSWAKDPAIGARMINARAETVAEKPAFRAAFKRRRCIVPADGYFEWQTIGKAKQPYLIHFADDRPFALAGLWETWHGPDRTDEAWETCTIITTAANHVAGTVHDRMPAILDPAGVERWLAADESTAVDLLDLLAPREWAGLATTAVSTHVNNVRHQDAGCIAAI